MSRALTEAFYESTDRMILANRRARKAIDILNSIDTENLSGRRAERVIYYLERTQLELSLAHVEHLQIMNRFIET